MFTHQQRLEHNMFRDVRAERSLAQQQQQQPTQPIVRQSHQSPDLEQWAQSSVKMFKCLGNNGHITSCLRFPAQTLKLRVNVTKRKKESKSSLFPFVGVLAGDCGCLEGRSFTVCGLWRLSRNPLEF